MVQFMIDRIDTFDIYFSFLFNYGNKEPTVSGIKNEG